MDRKTKFAFIQTLVIINLVTIVKFFYTICKALFISLLIGVQIDERLLEPISNYFIVVEINKYRMFHLHYFI